jgi:PAS domain S-box-containing protein
MDEIDTTCDVRPRKLRKGLTEYVLRTGHPLLATPDVYERLVAAGEAELIGAPSIDWLGVPLKVQDRTIGVVVTQTYEHGVRYGERERDILTFVSSQMAMAIERKRVQDAWREQSELLQRIVDNIPVMLVFLDEKGGIQWGNREWTRTLGYDIAEARSRDIFAELYPDQRERQRVLDSIGAPVGQWTDFRTRTKNGSVLNTIWANAPLTGGGWLAIGMDVSDRNALRSGTARSSRRAPKACPVSKSIPRSRSATPTTRRSTCSTRARALRSATMRWPACTDLARRVSSSARASPTSIR